MLPAILLVKGMRTCEILLYLVLIIIFVFSPQDQDESYHPDHTEEAVDGTDSEITEDRKFIVFESQLMMLFKRCRSCGLEMVELKTSTSGTLLEVSGTYMF